MLKATRASDHTHGEIVDRVVLAHDERHLRRKVLDTASGAKVLVDLVEPVALGHGDVLLLEDGGAVLIEAAPEALMEVRPAPGQDIAVLAWHLGNRHLAAEIGSDRILIQRDHVIRDMLMKLGASVADVVAPFTPVRGAYHSHAHSHTHGHSHDHAQGHGHSHGPDH
jgi:urease accessory protein